ncbi:MAG: hypothetical protein OYH76_14375 [Defluviicoccus sp.]|nr:hypothetical protein [Defluviicoccus sp.]MDE0277077.1 hypothetical protein [Defluviicoccus sp.]
MKPVDFVAQPASRTTLDVIETIAKGGDLTSLDIAAAYITLSGVHDMLKRTDFAVGKNWNGIKKRWITSFDYCRTQPLALDTLLSLPASSVRIHDAQFCLEHGGTPKIPFHPKAFLFRGQDHDFALAGSGNLSRSGLSKGVEVGLALAVERKKPIEPSAAATIKALRKWYTRVWKAATPLDPSLLNKYTKVFESVPNLSHPTATEDDLASDEITSGALSGKDLQKLRVCSNFWIEAGKITKNRGAKLPGNQLMMKRLSRVFFGFDPVAVSKNTTLGSVNIKFNGGQTHPYTLSYSDNKMDKLNLPKPGTIGPTAYDNQYLLFSQNSLHLFSLTIGTKAEKAGWLKKSRAINADFKMKGGREWGVF